MQTERAPYRRGYTNSRRPSRSKLEINTSCKTHLLQMRRLDPCTPHKYSSVCLGQSLQDKVYISQGCLEMRQCQKHKEHSWCGSVAHGHLGKKNIPRCLRNFWICQIRTAHKLPTEDTSRLAMSTSACLSKRSPGGHRPSSQPCPKNGLEHVHWPVPLAEVTSKPVRFFASLLFLASASSSQTPGQTSKHKEVLYMYTHTQSNIKSIVGYWWPLIIYSMPMYAPFFKYEVGYIHPTLYGTLRGKSVTNLRSVHFPVVGWWEGGWELRVVDCFVKRRIISVFLYHTSNFFHSFFCFLFFFGNPGILWNQCKVRYKKQ